MPHINRIVESVKRRSRYVGWALRKRKYAHESYSQYGEDMILRTIFARYPDSYHGFYIDIGAHHPLRFSNTYFFYEKGWQGVCVDPVPGGADLFARYRPRDVFLELGVADGEGELAYYMFKEPALNTFSLEAAERYGSQEPVGTRVVNVLPLVRILENWLPPGVTIDFMSIDAEGYDAQIMRSNNWKRYRPCVVVLEELSSRSLAEVAALEIDTFMQHTGYRLISWTPGALYYVDTTSPSYDGGVYLSFQQNR